MRVRDLNPQSYITDLQCSENTEQVQNVFAGSVEIYKWSEATSQSISQTTATEEYSLHRYSWGVFSCFNLYSNYADSQVTWGTKRCFKATL